MPKDIARLESVMVMIDRWSVAYSLVVLLVGGLQVLLSSSPWVSIIVQRGGK